MLLWVCFFKLTVDLNYNCIAFLVATVYVGFLALWSSSSFPQTPTVITVYVVPHLWAYSSYIQTLPVFTVYVGIFIVWSYSSCIQTSPVASVYVVFLTLWLYSSFTQRPPVISVVYVGSSLSSLVCSSFRPS